MPPSPPHPGGVCGGSALSSSPGLCELVMEKDARPYDSPPNDSRASCGVVGTATVADEEEPQLNSDAIRTQRRAV
jgi:hypothetical protein